MARLLGMAATVPWAAYALLYLIGKGSSPSGPLVIAGYVGLSAACIAWAVVTLRAPEAVGTHVVATAPPSDG